MATVPETAAYLSMSIASFGGCTLPKEEKKVWATKATNCIDDIEGARPKTTKLWTKPDLWDNSDVVGAKSKCLHPERTASSNFMRVDDIDGAQAKIRDKMLLTKREINPMTPQYKLPSHTPAPPFEPKFMRDTLDISDIDKAKPRIPVVYEMRDIISVQDIVGAQANYRARHQ